MLSRIPARPFEQPCERYAHHSVFPCTQCKLQLWLLRFFNGSGFLALEVDIDVVTDVLARSCALILVSRERMWPSLVYCGLYTVALV